MHTNVSPFLGRIRWQMVSEPELLSRAEFTLSCSPVLRDESSKDKPF